MLNHRSVNLIFPLLFILLLTLDLRIGISNWFYPALVLVKLGIMFWGSYFINSNYHIKTLCEVKTDKKEIAITFDDGPDKNVTPALLEVLNKHSAKAAFFCIGRKIEGNEAVLKKIDSEGHVIGNHSFSHSNFFDFFTAGKMKREFEQSDKLVFDAIGKQMNFYRPPYGITTPAMKKAVKEKQYETIGWSVRSMDSMQKNEQKLMNKLTKQLKPGAVFLFHDTWTGVVPLMDKFLTEAKAQGYTIVRPDELFNVKAYK
ncbi:MAG: polysaccharide deacetylase family protein [Bacteroidia bacterium]